MMPFCVCKPRLALLLGLSLATPAALATEAARDNLDAAVLELLEQPGSADQGVRVIEQPARTRYELGAVVDARPGDGGLPRVMAITPGGAADRMGLQAGDRILAVNGADLSADDAAAAQLRDAVQDPESTLQLRVQRGGAEHALQGQVDRVDLPAYRLEIQPRTPAEGCGRVSVTLKPPISQGLYPALLHEVDGRLPGPLSNTVFRLPAGRHVLKLSELIDGDRFTQQENLRRGQLMRHERYKYLELNVEPDTHYRLGVRFDKDKTSPIRDQAYWEPVAWKQFAEPCH